MILSLTVILVAWAVARAGGFRDPVPAPVMTVPPKALWRRLMAGAWRAGLGQAGRWLI